MDQIDSGAKDGNMPQFIKNVPWYLDNKNTQNMNHQKSTTTEPAKTDIN